MIQGVTLNNTISVNSLSNTITSSKKDESWFSSILSSADTFESKMCSHKQDSSLVTTIGIAGGIVLTGIGLKYGKNIIQYLKKTKDLKKICINPELQKTADYKLFKDFKICENLNQSEKRAFFGIAGGENNYELYNVLMGKRAVGEICNFEAIDLAFLNKLKLPKGIEILPCFPCEGFGINHEYCISFVNKPELFKIFEKNKEVFTKRFGLDVRADNETIYTRIKDELRFKDVFVNNIPNNKLKHDLYGMCMGFPKYNTMIFQLERTGEIPIELRQNPIEYKKQLLNVLHGENSPYKNLSKKELHELEKAINNIKTPNFSERSPYERYIEITCEKDEFKRIETAAQEFNEIFSIDKMIKGIYS